MKLQDLVMTLPQGGLVNKVLYHSILICKDKVQKVWCLISREMCRFLYMLIQKSIPNCFQKYRCLLTFCREKKKKNTIKSSVFRHKNVKFSIHCTECLLGQKIHLASQVKKQISHREKLHHLNPHMWPLVVFLHNHVETSVNRGIYHSVCMCWPSRRKSNVITVQCLAKNPIRSIS